MKRLLVPVSLLCVFALSAQTPPAGSVNSSTITTVTAAAPAGAAVANQIVCIFSDPAKPTVHVVCTFNGATVVTEDATPAVGSTNGFIGSLALSGNSITWIVQQPTAGVISWQIAANGTSQAGSF